MTEFWLARHGQTDWNVEGRYQGHADVPLNALGVEQAHLLAERLAERRYDAIFSSDLARARMTAEVAAARLGLPLRVDARLREIDQGDWEGELVREIAQRYAERWQVNPADPEGFGAPNGETIGQVAARMNAAVEAMGEEYPQGRVVVVSHGLAVAILICRAGGYPLGKVYEHIPPNAEPVRVEF